ncbi:MmgE/PrpD family protein [Mycobacterium avium]|jgi:2-methylcitrate dehydratase PrpD|uniref:MmgE/PrpD family protein n=2 Tax=Mycobacterium avium TaxID=1764 RepID=A0A0H3A0R6_MYCA1|nr:MmgE/PrpD family protein [Mycobacterium avium]ETA93131.1 MmgE/PrpD family protein [Mycobacterium avium 05-4293]ETB10952.1 MmgE/PrpD family protein [Mycobacterium avium subsp. silvaticum ATCC 49884]ETB17773.1 MmgE/PrpD family protein [Mycobacterium avium subsp. avium 10-9275]ETB22132.1 MmgE/PrpD family protein [Mycobacterium avium subsp. avium 11-4751]ETB26353.1 MmgE/PrpD family protein [Mycobacterium avium 09-5983]ETB48459.1 MmgE/PrpD family protein [Mycobacterium avium 11-0986]TXA41183.1
MTALQQETVTDPVGPTGLLATWVAELTLDDVPPPVVDRAKHLLLDGIGCALVGAQLPWSRIATDAVLALEGSGDSIVIGTGRRTSAPAAAVLNGTFIQGFELDDFHPLAPLHSCSLLIPALLSTAATRSATTTGRELLPAAIAGFEVGPRVGHALHGTQMLDRGWHSGPVFGTHAAAMASGKLRGLPPAQLEDALGLAGTQSAGLMAAQYEAMSKRMHHGLAARNGFYAAGLAAAGYTGIKRVFEREYGGFLSVFGEGHDPDAAALTADLGQRWETSLIMVKSYAAMGGLHGAIDAARRLRNSVAPQNISSVDITVGETVYKHGWWLPERPLTPIGAQMNIGYATAAALLDGNVLPEQFTAARLDADDIWALISATRVHLDESLADADITEKFRTDLAVTTREGTVHRARVALPHGAPNDPVTNDEVVAKFHALADRVTSRGRAAAIERAVIRLDDLTDVENLMDLLADPVAGALD